MIYDYQCNKCKEVFEVRANLAQKEAGFRPDCPKCGSAATKQVIRSVNLTGGLKPSSGGSFTPPCCGSGSDAGCC